MDITPWLKPWSDILLVTNFLLTCGIIVLCIEAAYLVRTLVLTRQTPSYYMLLALPLGASVLFYFLTLNDWQAYAGFKTYGFLTLGKVYPPGWHDWSAIQMSCMNAALIGLLQCVLVIVLFTLTLMLERKLLPHIQHPPLWTVVRRQRIV